MRRSPHLLTVTVALCLAAMPVAQATGDTFKPTRFDDPKPNGCKPTNCSLREAVSAANVLSDKDTVQLSKGTYELTRSEEPPSSPLEGGGLELIGPIRMAGAGAAETRIDANGVDRVIEIGYPPYVGAQKARLTGLTLKGGDPGAAGANEGGGIYSNGIFLTLIGVVIKDNAAQFGGGIEHRGVFFTMKRSTIKNNNGGEGGGIHVISQDGDRPEMNIDDSTISGNNASKGGGILADGAALFGSLDPSVFLTNSTVARNSSAAEGGGLMSDNGALIELDNSTVAYNTADADGIGGGVGGGIHQHTGALLQLGDSIIAANTVGATGSGPDCSATQSFGNLDGGNVLTAGPTDCPGITAADNQFVGSALIDPLADNGGPTRTIALRALSPALGYANSCPPADQRGESRGANCDSGAYERKGD